MLSTRPRTTVTVKRRVSVGAVGCNCGSGSAVNVMRALGMKTAARMHGKTAKASEWTADDWRQHIAEERTILFPALLAVGAHADVIASLDIDHSLYLALLENGHDLPIGAAPHSVDRHGKIEDDLVEKYAKALLARAGSSVTVSGLGSGLDPNKLAADMETAAAKDAADRALRVKEANAKLDDWGKAVDKYSGTPLGSWASGTAKMALAVEGAIVRWAQGDWDSDDQKARALDSVQKALAVGIVPEKFDADLDFAKTYGDKVWTEINRAGELGDPWNGVFHDYAQSLLANAGTALIDSLVPQYSGAFSQELGTPMLCAAIAGQTGAGNEQSGPSPWPTKYGLANMLAAVATARFGTPLAGNLETAYAALGKLIPAHPTICSGRGYKGDADSWEYDHGPYLYVLQAWIDLVPPAHANAIMHPGTLAELPMMDKWAGKYVYAAPVSSTASKAGYLAAFAIAGYLAWRYVA